MVLNLSSLEQVGSAWVLRRKRSEIKHSRSNVGGRSSALLTEAKVKLLSFTKCFASTPHLLSNQLSWLFVEIRLIAMLHACHIPNDRLYKEQWNLKKIGAPEAWRIRTFAGSLTSAGSFQQPMKKWFSFSWVFKK